MRTRVLGIVLTLLAGTSWAGSAFIPIASSAVSGSGGSLWVTEHQVRNPSDEIVWVTLTIGCQWSAEHACDMPIPPHTTLSLSHPDPTAHWFFADGQRLVFSSHLRETATNAEAWGTEIPVAREWDWREGPLEILNVPNDPERRLSIRAYAFQGDEVRTFQVAVTGVSSGDGWLVQDVFGPEARSYAGTPAYGGVTRLELHDVLREFQVPPTVKRLRITVTAPAMPAAKLWGFASITNNETQHVTIFSRQ